MKIMFVGDVHADFEALAALLPIARRAGCRRVVQVGDFGWNPADAFFAAAVAKLDRALTAHELVLYWLDGNHDRPWLTQGLRTRPEDGVGVILGQVGQARCSERIRYLPRGSRWEWGGLSFCALGGADSTIERFMGVPDVAIDPRILPTSDDVSRAVANGPADVLLTHDCGVTDSETLRLLFGVERDHPAARLSRHRVREVLESVEPTLHLHGHYHRRTSYTVLLRRRVVQTTCLADLAEGGSGWIILDTDALPD